MDGGTELEISVAAGGTAMNDQEAYPPVILIKTTSLIHHQIQALRPNAPAMAEATATITLRTVPHTDFFINYFIFKLLNIH